MLCRRCKIIIALTLIPTLCFWFIMFMGFFGEDGVSPLLIRDTSIKDIEHHYTTDTRKECIDVFITSDRTIYNLEVEITFLDKNQKNIFKKTIDVGDIKFHRIDKESFDLSIKRINEIDGYKISIINGKTSYMMP